MSGKIARRLKKIAFNITKTKISESDEGFETAYKRTYKSFKQMYNQGVIKFV